MGFDQFAFGKRFKELRKERKLTQEQLADRLGISDRHVRGIEHGDFFPSIDLYILIAQVFQVSQGFLVFEGHPILKFLLNLFHVRIRYIPDADSLFLFPLLLYQ